MRTEGFIDVRWLPWLGESRKELGGGEVSPWVLLLGGCLTWILLPGH